jgi:hypothetical protein
MALWLVTGCPEKTTGQAEATSEVKAETSVDAQAETAPEVAPEAGAELPESPKSTLGASDTGADDAAMAKVLAIWAELEKAKPDPAAVKTAWSGELATWVAESDAYAGTATAAEMDGILLEADVLDLEAARGALVLNLTQHLRKRLKSEVSEKYPNPTTPTADLLHQWDRGWAITQALLPLGKPVDALGDSIAADLQAAFDAGNLGIQANSHFAVGGARQTVEKTLLRLLDRLVVTATQEARALANPTPANFRAQKRAEAYLGSVADRLEGRNSRGLADLRKMLAGPIIEVDPQLAGTALQIAWARRTYKYTRHATDDPTLIGTEGGALSAVEGKTYYRIIAPGTKLAVGADTAATLAVWDAWIEAIQAGDVAGAKAAGAKLEAEVCGYQKALGLGECAHDKDTPASKSTFTGCDTDAECGGGSCLTPGACITDSPCGRCAATLEPDLLATAEAFREVIDAIDAGDRAAALAKYLAAVSPGIIATDATLKLEGDQSLDPQVKALLAEGTSRVHNLLAKWTLRDSSLRVFKKFSSEVVSSVGGAGSIQERLTTWETVLLAFAYGWWSVGLAEDAAAISVTLDGFDRANAGLQDDDPWEAGAGRQAIEKTAYRILVATVLNHAAAAKSEGDAGLAAEHAAEAYGALTLLGDRVSEKVGPEAYAALVAQLDGTTLASAIDTTLVATSVLQALAQRTFKYTKHAEDSPELYGTADGYLKSVEGATYFSCIATALYTSLAADAATWDKMWSRWQSAIATGNTTRGAPTSDFLETGVCDFEKALGMEACK